MNVLGGPQALPRGPISCSLAAILLALVPLTSAPPQQSLGRWDSFGDKWLQRGPAGPAGELWDICCSTCLTPERLLEGTCL